MNINFIKNSVSQCLCGYSKSWRIILFTLILHFTFLILNFSPAYAGIEIKRDVLENGLTLMVVERHNLPIVMVTVGIKGGSLIEPAEKAGLANLTAELLPEGTKKRTSTEISEEIEFVGASLHTSGGDDYITVSLSILKKDLDLGFDILSDIIISPSFPQEELDKKRERIKGSLRSYEENPDFVAQKAFKEALFGLHPYGRLIEGTSGTLDHINQRYLKDFHSAYYVPNNAIMSVVGDITPEEATSLIKKYFSKWKGKELKIPSVEKPKPLKDKKTISIDKNITQANIILGHMGISRDNPDYYALSVMNYILGGGGFASRLMQNLRDEKGLTYDIHSFFEAKKENGSFQIGIQTKNESASMATDEILKEIKRIRETLVSDAELQDAKAFLTGSFPMKIEAGKKIASFLVAMEYYELGLDYINKYPAYINAVTKDDVLRVAKKYLNNEKFILVIVANEKRAGLKIE
ncbi:MAG: insulinase family protein [Nitrospirae bacterium]|nr:insulinase family protein [Nitrospirota bacterium]